MYWYISFLRPPPVSVSSGTKEITITPQVANDLRTELRYEPTTIYYTWQRLSPTISPLTPSKELTTFIPPQSTYKPISVPLPGNVRIGESWRLGLFSIPSDKGKTGEGEAGPGPGPSSSLLRLCEDHVDVLGVWSEGINVIRSEALTTGVVRGIDNGKSSIKSKEKPKDKGKGKAKDKEKEKDDIPKQGRITRDFNLPQEGVLTVVEQTSFDLDKKIWDSGLALSSWIWRYINSSHDHPLANRVIGLIRKEGHHLNILELGSGTGLVSIALCLSLNRFHPNLKRKVIATDLESAIPLMNENISLNFSQERSNTINVDLEAQLLDWDDPLPGWVSSNQPELIIAADVTYNTSAFPSLLRTLLSLLKPTPSSSSSSPSPSSIGNAIKPLLALAYKQRDPAERGLWDMLTSHGVNMVLVDRIRGAEEDGETEIWIGGFGKDTP
ncbi:uncharacterized protein IL334_002555 [Kwoniella shivajii]|uniref:Methyltransferase-domain-containing protein n=1 Tax=Kwoniella shivajii TaxID=564305 RepID=A0ABZ1CVE6_9TREE|nr:hypothetical protein IL334_002555 [Kwoniella shivajii]